MSQDHKVINFTLKKNQKTNNLSNKEKLVYAYHYITQDDVKEALKLLNTVSQQYYQTQLYKDIARALLCYSTFQTTNHVSHGKESEFYLVIYRLAKYVLANKLQFKYSSYFNDMRDELFKDFNL